MLAATRPAHATASATPARMASHDERRWCLAPEDQQAIPFGTVEEQYGLHNVRKEGSTMDHGHDEQHGKGNPELQDLQHQLTRLAGAWRDVEGDAILQAQYVRLYHATMRSMIDQDWIPPELPWMTAQRCRIWRCHAPICGSCRASPIPGTLFRHRPKTSG